MEKILFWIYLINAILIINHEIESAYWKEWKLFKLPGEITGFVLLHFPVLFIILYGLILVYEGTLAGYILSVLLGFGGIFAFSIHSYFIKKGNEEFKLPISKFILISTLIVSIIQLILTFYLILS